MGVQYQNAEPIQSFLERASWFKLKINLKNENYPVHYILLDSAGLLCGHYNQCYWVQIPRIPLRDIVNNLWIHLDNIKSNSEYCYSHFLSYFSKVCMLFGRF